MLGSLNKVWPWKEVEKLVSDGHEVMIEHNIAPNTEVAEAVVLMLIGFIFGVCIGKDFSQKGITDWMEMYKKKLLLAVGSIVCRIPLLFLGQTFSIRVESRVKLWWPFHVAAGKLGAAGEQWGRVGIQASFFPLVHRSDFYGGRCGERIHLPHAFGFGLVGHGAGRVCVLCQKARCRSGLYCRFAHIDQFRGTSCRVACRVDMVLTAMMVIALYQLYKWGERPERRALGGRALLECGGP